MRDLVANLIYQTVLLQITQLKLATFFSATAFLDIKAEISFWHVNLQK